MICFEGREYTEYAKYCVHMYVRISDSSQIKREWMFSYVCTINVHEMYDAIKGTASFFPKLKNSWFPAADWKSGELTWEAFKRKCAVA